MFEVITFGKCPYCDKAKALLNEKGLEFRESPLDSPEKKEAFRKSGFTTVPQIYDGAGNHIGGYDELVIHLSEKEGFET